MAAKAVKSSARSISHMLCAVSTVHMSTSHFRRIAACTCLLTVPLVAYRSISMRRTASWGSRDAFTDGHISRHTDSPTVPQGRRTLAATSKAHRQKTCLVPSANYQMMLQQPPVELDSDNVYNIMQRAFPTGEAVRRTSAPEAPAGMTHLTADQSC